MKNEEKEVKYCGECRWNNFGYCGVYGWYVKDVYECCSDDLDDLDDFERDEKNGA